MAVVGFLSGAWKINLQYVPTLAIGVGHHPTLPNVYAAGWFAEGLRLQQGRFLQGLFQFGLLNGVPRLFRGMCSVGQECRCRATQQPCEATSAHVRLPLVVRGIQQIQKDSLGDRIVVRLRAIEAALQIKLGKQEAGRAASKGVMSSGHSTCFRVSTTTGVVAHRSLIEQVGRRTGRFAATVCERFVFRARIAGKTGRV